MKRQSEISLKSGWIKGDSITSIGSHAGAKLFSAPGFDWRAADAYLFDIDGTLLNSQDAIHYWAFHRGVQQVYGMTLDTTGVPIHGNTDLGILRGFMEKNGIAESEWLPKLPALVETMCLYVEENAPGLRPKLCPSIRDLIEYLDSSGKLLGVVSGNLERIGWAKLQACGLKQWFSFGAFSDRNEKRVDIFAEGIEQVRFRLRPDAGVYIVGDTPADIAAAHANGISIIAVATGIYDPHELLNYGPEMCASCCSDLLSTPAGSQTSENCVQPDEG